MEKMKRLLALALCALLLLTNLPLQALAAEQDGTEVAKAPVQDIADVTGIDTLAEATEEELTADLAAVAEPLAAEDVVKVEKYADGAVSSTTYYANLQSAFDGFAPANNTYGGKYVITLLGNNNGNLNKNLQYPTDLLDITLDLNGFTITGDGSTVAVVINFGSKAASGSTFTIKDSSGSNAGQITGGKGGVKVDGTNCIFYFQSGTITGNHGSSKGGGILMGAKAKLVMTGGVITGNSVTGTSSANTGYGGGVLANYADILGGVITGNTAYAGSHVQSGRGGGLSTEITRTKGYSTLNIASGVIFGNTAGNAGDDLMVQGNGLTGTKYTLIIGTENWFIDGWNGTKATTGNGEADRYSAEAPVAYTDGGISDTNKPSIGLKYVAPAIPEYTVTYTDGVEDEEIFADQSYTVKEGEATPAFNGEPTREGYNFLGWSPEPTDTVTADATYAAQWELAVVYVAQLESTGEKFETLQAALDAAKAALEGDLDADKITLLNNTTESVNLAWLRSNGSMTLTIDLAGYTVTGNGSSVMAFSGVTNYSNNFHIVIEDSSEAKTGTLTGGSATSGGAIKMSGLKSGDSLTVNGGNFVNNTASSTGGALYAATVGAKIIINGGSFTGNTANSGGAISAYNVTVNGGTITGNAAVGTATNSGRGGGIQLWGTTTYLTVTGGQIYGNTATRYGDDIVFCSTSTAGASSPSMALINAADMGVAGVAGWYVDGFNGSFSNEAGLTERYGPNYAVEFTDYADFSGKEAKGNAVALKAGTEPLPPAPEAPDKYGKNVTTELIRVICDSDEAHAPLTVKWQSQSTKVRTWVSGVVWSEEHGTYIVPIRIDSVSVYYVWANFEKIYNDILHEMVDEDQKCIDTYLKWDFEKQLWVTMDGNPIDVHVTCKTAPDAPIHAHLSSFQIKVIGPVDGEEAPYFINLSKGTYTVSEVKGSREEGFTADITVTLEDGDAYVTGWCEKRAPGANYAYDWDRTEKTVTFTMKYDASTTSTLYGSRTSDWVLASTGKRFGTVGTAYVMPAKPEAPKQANVTSELVTVICDTDPNHAATHNKWYPNHCDVLSGAEIVWNEELMAWTVDVKISGLFYPYVNSFEDTYNKISHDLVEDITTVYTTLKWDPAQSLWFPIEPVELHVACRTVPIAPVYRQLRSYQIKVWGDVDGELLAYTTSIPEDGYTIGEVYGSREEGFFVDVTVNLSEGDIYQTNWIEKRNPGFYYNYDWEKTATSYTFTLRYNGDLNGTLYGDRHAANTNYDWVLNTTGKTFGTIAEAYLEQVKATVQVVIYRNGDTTTPYKTVSLGKIAKGTVLDLTELDINDYYTASRGFEFEGWYNDGKWNQYKAGQNPAGLTEIKINGWTNIICMVTDYQAVVVYGVTNGDKENAEVIFTGSALKGENLIEWLEANVEIPSKLGYTADQWYNWDWYGHKLGADTTVNGWTNVYVTYSPITYSIKYNAGEGSYTGSLPNHGSNWLIVKNGYTYDAPVTLYDGTDFVRAGYKLIGWTVGGVTYELGQTVERNFTYVQDGTVQAYAVWEPITYSIKYNAGEGSYTGSLPNHGSNWLIVKNGYTYDAPVTLYDGTDFVRTGYTLVGWTVGGVTYELGQTVEHNFTNVQNGTVQAYAVWEANEYTVTFNTNGGEPIDPITVVFDQKYGRLPSSSVTGLSGGDSNWYLVDENGNVTDTKVTRNTVVSTARDHELFVVRKVLAPTLKLTLTVPGAISDNYQYYVPGASERVLTVTVNNMNEEVLDYTYEWYKDGVLIEGATESVLTLPGNVSDSGTYKVVVTATLKNGNGVAPATEAAESTGIVVTSDTASASKELKVKIMHAANTLYYDANGGEGGPSSNYTGGDTATVQSSQPTRTGYTFAGWNTAADGSGDAYQGGDSFVFVDDNGNGGVSITLYAQWTANKYTVTLDANGGVVDPATVEVSYNGAIGELPVPTKEGYTFAGWVDGEGNPVTAETVYDLTDDSTITAQWTANEYTVTLDANGGEVDPATLDVTFDGAVGELPVPTKEGYTFAGWVDGEGNPVTAETVYTVADDSTIAAQWTANEYTVTLDAGEGTVEDDTLTVTYGEPVGELPTPTREGYVFAGWVDANGDPVTAETVYSTAGDLTLTATWKKPVDPTSPGTGDNIHMVAFTMLGSLLGLAALLLIDRKVRKAI